MVVESTPLEDFPLNTYLWDIVCIHTYLLLIYHILRYHGNSFIKQRPIKISKKWHKKPIRFINFLLFDKIDMKCKISVSELTPPRNFSLIPLKIKSWRKVGL